MVRPGVVFVGPPATQAPAASQPIIVGGLNAVNDALRRRSRQRTRPARFDRQAWAGLITPVGGFLLGRQYTPLRNPEQVQRDRRSDRVAVWTGLHQPEDSRQQLGAVPN